MKKMLSAILSIALLMSLFACGKAPETASWQEQYDLGVRYLSEGNYEEAILAFAAAIEIDPKRIDAYLGRAEAYIGAGENETNLAAALADYEKILELDESNAAAWLGLADVYIRQGDFEKALEVLKSALEKCENTGEIADKIAEMESGNITDASGKMRRRSAYDGAGNLIWYHMFTYGDRGRTASVTSFDGQGNQTGHVDMKYDDQGRPIVNYSWYNETGQVDRMEFDYDEDGQIIERRGYDADNGELSDRHVIIYNGTGNILREDYYYFLDGIEHLSYYAIYEYDEQGRRAKEFHYGADNTLLSYFTYTYLDGEEVQTCYDGEGNFNGKTVHRYDKNGDFIGIDEYDENGDLIQSTYYE